MIYLAIIISFFVGAIPFGIIVVWLSKRIDIRRYGSGNSGATNVWRVAGPLAGTLTFALDFLKGLLPVAVSSIVFKNFGPFSLLLIGIAAVCGHIFSPFLGFKGGKGVATGAGVFTALLPVITLLGFFVFGLTVALSRYVSLGSMVAAIFVTLAVWITGRPAAISVCVTLTAVLIIVMHRANIKRLLNGTENGFGKK